MGWDNSDEDDDWDAEDIEAKLEAQLKEKERAKRRAEGYSDSDEEKPPEPPKEQDEPEAKPKPKPKPKKKGKDKAEEVKEEEVPPQDSQAEKLRRQKLVEEADARLADDLFSGCDTPDEEAAKKAKEEEERKQEEEARKAREAAKPKVVIVDAFDQVHLEVRADVEKLCMTCVEKVNKGQAKGASLMFLKNLLVQLESGLELKELEELEKEFAGVLKEKQVQKGAQQSKANKANTQLSKRTKFDENKEWEEVYGGGEGDEDWTQEEWDEWYRTQGKT
mmetsp:Transcript_21246/g.49470  ORF Transcript_21246/g.49470 Transcript_21246/m.49470 type:complete len:277 (-) Transcript_21246:150-980(-)